MTNNAVTIERDDALEKEIATLIKSDCDATGGPEVEIPLIFRELNEAGRVAVVGYMLDKLEAIGLDPRADYADLTDDDDEDDDDDDDDDLDDDFDDDDDDRWPGDNDDDEDDAP
jgi:hypothetical protein